MWTQSGKPPRHPNPFAGVESYCGFRSVNGLPRLVLSLDGSPGCRSRRSSVRDHVCPTGDRSLRAQNSGERSDGVVAERASAAATRNAEHRDKGKEFLTQTTAHTSSMLRAGTTHNQCRPMADEKGRYGSGDIERSHCR